MTEGKPLPLMVRFSIPLLISNILQLFYTIADSAVVGRMLGVTAFASVGSTAALHWLVLSVVISMSHGFGIVFAQRFGAKDMDGLRKAFATAVYLAVMISAAVGFTGVIGGRFLLRRLDTPQELLDGAAIYLGWLLGGIAISFIYNIMGSMLRALGDSSTPLKAMIITSLLNIVLDIAFAIPFGIAGIAAATLLAQLAACIYCYIGLRGEGVLRGVGVPGGEGVLRGVGVLRGAGANWDASYARKLLRLGIPLGFRNGVIQAGGLVVQRYVNSYGMEFVAGIAAAKRMYSMLTVAGGAFEAAIGTFTAQNFGAGKYDRINLGVTCGRRLMLASAALIMIIVLPLRYYILGLLLESGTDQIHAILDIGARQLAIMAIGLPLLYLLFLYRSTLEGIGKPFIPMLSGFMELTVRVTLILSLAPTIGETAIMLADPAGWVAALVLLILGSDKWGRSFLSSNSIRK